MPDTALSGLKVLEFGNLVSAPYCTKLMADLGAEVVKIEAPGVGDEARRREPFAQDKPGIERSGLYAYLNANKLSVTLDPSTAVGKKLFCELAGKVDFLVENNPPALMEGLGLTYEALEKINPMLIMTSITPFGQTGPFRNYKAYEITAYSASGYGYGSTACIREPVMPPVKAGGRPSQFSAAQVGSVASMFALFARDQIGAGQHVDVSIQEVMAGHYESAIEHWTFAANEIGGLTNPILQPMLPLECKDGWVFLMCIEDFQFDRYVEVMGNPEWATNELFKDRFSRAAYLDALWPLLTEWTMQHTKEEVFQKAQANRVPVAPAYNAEEIVNSPQLAAQHYFVEIDHPVIGKARYPGAPYTLSETPWRIERKAPLLGEHNEDIYCGWLGYTREELVKFTEIGAI
ncbi:MAG: CoA transferase [Deltaproteobacteria bacterium]|nr:CoA transferase [Deltaproteobacteria bacterium]